MNTVQPMTAESVASARTSQILVEEINIEAMLPTEKV